ncbi:hypothetical protein HUW82_05395 [Fusobacterium polymorphum]
MKTPSIAPSAQGIPLGSFGGNLKSFGNSPLVCIEVFINSKIDKSLVSNLLISFSFILSLIDRI